MADFTKDGRQRSAIQPGSLVDIIAKRRPAIRETLSGGVVQEILTNSATHPHGIKVRLKDGHVGRVAEILGN